MTAVLPVILAGGAGTRLWPLSRELYPKQFLKLTGPRTMLQETLGRLDGLNALPPYLICNEDHRFIVAEQCRAMGIEWGAIVLEPAARNTAPAIALAALNALSNHGDTTLLVLAADHHIRDTAAFRAAVADGADLVSEDQLLTFGIVPDHPETGYGYIKAGAAIGARARKVAQFVEKPDLATAKRYVAAGEYYWNSGMFMFKASTYLNELKVYRPDIFSVCERASRNMSNDLDFQRPGAEFAESPAESIDYAVMEKTDRSVVLPIDVGWSDVGSWKSLWEVSDRDADDNDVRGDVIAVDTSGSLLISEGRLVATVGVRDLVVIETADAVLVAQQDRAQDVKRIVETLRSSKRAEHQTHQRVYRPWGSYETVEQGDRYQAKRLTVNPGATLSLQMHHHRSEHWIVVQGTATVTCGEKEFVVHENESTYIPIGTKHRLANPGKIPLHLIEVQVGSYLGEDDIVRFKMRTVEDRPMRIVVTGGAGFIGSALVRHLVRERSAEVCTIDKLTYSGSLDNLTDVAESPRHRFQQIDICDATQLRSAIFEFAPDAIVHLAAETHVDRSIDGPSAFVQTNVVGTYQLLEVARQYAKSGNKDEFRFLHVSTDEVYGSLGAEGLFSEESPYCPNSPYSASKAGSDHLARAWFETYGLPVLVTNCSNNYGPFQFPEKLIPMTILKALQGQPIPVYGDGLQIRDWLHVDDHVRGLVGVLERGLPGRSYNIGGGCERTNLAIVESILRAVARRTGKGEEEMLGLVQFVADRPGHDRRYAIDARRMRDELGWSAQVLFEEGIDATVAWYATNRSWCERRSNVYAGQRLGAA